MHNFIYLLVFLVDISIGDPKKIPHPVILIGKLIAKLEGVIYPWANSNIKKLVFGGVLVVIVLSVTYVISFYLIYLVNLVHPLLGFVLNIWLISTTIAIKGLKDVGQKIKKILEDQDLKEARKQVGYIVGRDTDKLNETELIRASIETIAENIVDAITSPLFFALLGGAPLAMTYRAVNTLDSMLGYRDEKYFYFGKIAARVDDIFNYIPARFTSFFLIISACLLPDLSGRDSLRIFHRDKFKHPSPNSGLSESAVAGALRIQLGGLNYYNGEPSQRPYIGDGILERTTTMIEQTINLMLLTAGLWVFGLTIISLCWERYFL